jgi:DNA-binding HxlR family transcriptional regulator
MKFSMPFRIVLSTLLSTLVKDGLATRWRQPYTLPQDKYDLLVDASVAKRCRFDTAAMLRVI